MLGPSTWYDWNTNRVKSTAMSGARSRIPTVENSECSELFLPAGSPETTRSSMVSRGESGVFRSFKSGII
jgi:hypothetical protein